MSKGNAYQVDKIDILLVDDKNENLYALEAALASPAYHLIKTNSGEEALRYLLSHTPALILLDVQMPEMDGFETAAMIKRNVRTREIPIIFVTATNSDDQYMRKGYEHGAVDYLYKPYDISILKSKVSVFVEIKRQHERINRLVAVQSATTQSLSDIKNESESIPQVLESICTSLGWDLGTFWKMDRRKGTLNCFGEWYSPFMSSPTQLADGLRNNLSLGMDLPAKVWTSGKTFWRTENESDSTDTLFSTAVGIPIFNQNEIVGVLEFFSQHTQMEDPDLLRILSALASQIGQVLRRTEALDQAKSSEALKSAILETALDCVISINHEGKIIDFNPAAENTFGYLQRDVIGKEMAEVIIPPALREAHREGLRRSVTGPMKARRTEVLAMRADQTEFPVELTITKVSSVDPPIFTGYLRDITEQKKVEMHSIFLAEVSATLASTMDYKKSFQTLANLAVQSLASWCTIDVVEDGKEIHSVASAHAHSKTEFLDALHRSYPQNAVPNVLKTGKSEFHPVIDEAFLNDVTTDPNTLKQLKELNLKSCMIVPLIARGKTFGVMTLVTGGSTRVYAENDLAFAEELARRSGVAIDNSKLYSSAQDAILARDEFFSIASHELKTPITSLKMQLQLTKRHVLKADQSSHSEKLHKALDISVKQVDRLTHLTDDLLDVAKIQAGKLSFDLQKFNLSDLVKEVVDGYSEAAKLAHCPIDYTIEQKIIGVWDKLRLQQVVNNLLSNSIKYAPGKPIRVEVKNDKGKAKIMVKDSGPGISPDQQTRIFERFTRANTIKNISGLGLGLFIVKQIVEAHHGNIQVESQPGQGSAFFVELPILKNETTLHQTPRYIQ